MTLSEMRSQYPQIPEPQERDAVGVSRSSYSNDESDERLKGISYISPAFYEGRLFYLAVHYKDSSSRQEVALLTKPLNSSDGFVICEGFTAYISQNSESPQLSITDRAAFSKIGKLEADLKENAADCPGPPSNTRRPARHDRNPIQDSLSARSRSEKAQ